jgi:hypothetical protein
MVAESAGTSRCGVPVGYCARGLTSAALVLANFLQKRSLGLNGSHHHTLGGQEGRAQALHRGATSVWGRPASNVSTIATMNFFSPTSEKAQDNESFKKRVSEDLDEQSIAMPRYSTAGTFGNSPQPRMSINLEGQNIMDIKRKVVDEAELDDRIAKFRMQQQGSLIASAKDRVRIDPESKRYQAWLMVGLFVGLFSVATTGYYIAYVNEFSSFNPVFVLDWVRLSPFSCFCLL